MEILYIDTVGETGASCYTFYIFCHKYTTNRAIVTFFNLFDNTKYRIHLMLKMLIATTKSSNISTNLSFKICVTTFPVTGARCYMTRGKLLHFLLLKCRR